MPLESERLFERISTALGTTSVERIAEFLALSKQSVYLWRKGKPPSLETLIQIADSSHTSLHWLVTGQGPQGINGSEPIEAPARERGLQELVARGEIREEFAQMLEDWAARIREEAK